MERLLLWLWLWWWLWTRPPDFAWRTEDDRELVPPSCLRRRMLYRFLAAREVRLGKCWWTMSLQLRPVWETRWRSLASCEPKTRNELVFMLVLILGGFAGKTHLLCRPRALVDAGIEAVVPALPALVAVAGAHHLGNLAPPRAVQLDGLAELLVLLAHPRSLADRVGDAVVPPLAAVLVVAPREVGRDLVPTDGAVARSFWGFVSC